MTKKSRDDFSEPIINNLKLRAAFICSNPKCRIVTIGPSPENHNKYQYIGIAAHISAASKGGPRYNELLTPTYRKSIENAIFLCSNCANMIDKNNGIDYSIQLLEKWKSDHEKWVLSLLNKPLSNNNDINEQKDYDKKLFTNSNELFKESNLKTISNCLIKHEWIYSDNLDLLNNFESFLSESTYQYLNIDIENSKIKLLNSLCLLIDFIDNLFEVYPRDQKRDNYKLCMKPSVNIDREGIHESNPYDEHKKLYIELNNLVHNLNEDYKTYRLNIRKNLYM